MTGKLQGKTAIITGCSGGIGKELAIRFADEGADLAICARRADKLYVTKERCEQAGVRVLAIPCDVCVPEQLAAFVDKTVETFGKIDILVNNAVSAYPGTPFMEQSEELLMEVFTSGFLATWRLCKLCFPYLKESRGNVINFGSAAGLKGTAQYAAYAATKEAIRSLTRTLANEWGGYGIVVNAICPTAVTDRMKEFMETLPEEKRKLLVAGQSLPPVGRTGDPYDDIGPLAVFLASRDASFITGQSIRIDGGASIFAL